MYKIKNRGYNSEEDVSHLYRWRVPYLLTGGEHISPASLKRQEEVLPAAKLKQRRYNFKGAFSFTRHTKNIHYREEFLMARQVNYDQKIEAIKAKIETKSAQLRDLKEELAKIEKAAAASKNEEIANFIVSKGLNPAEVLAVLQERFGQN